MTAGRAAGIFHGARRPRRARIIFPPQFFGTFPFPPPGEAPFGGFNAEHGPQRPRHRKKETQMSASSTEESKRPWIVDFLSTLFLAFCIGIATSVVLAVAVVLMAGEARGADGVQLIETVPLAAPEDEQDTVLIKSETPPSCRERFAGAAPRSEGRTCRAGRDEERGSQRCRSGRGESSLPGCRAAKDSSPRTLS